MPDIVLDRYHSGAWHIAPDGGDASAAPEEKYLGHLADLTEVLGEHLGEVTIGSIDAAWEADALDGADLLVLTLPTADEPPLTARDLELLRGHLTAGRGLLVLGGSAVDTVPCELSGLVPGLVLDPGFVSVRRQPPAGHLLTYSVSAEALPGHPVTEGVEELYLHRARSLTLTGSAVTGIAARDGRLLAAAGEVGAGRIVVVGGGELFALPFLGRADNARFLLNTLSWLLTGQYAPAGSELAKTITHERCFTVRSFPPEEDLAQVEGPHVVDAWPYRSLLERIGGGLLPDPYRDQAAFLVEAELRFDEMPRVIREAVTTFRHRSNDYEGLLVRGLPVDAELPATPADPGRKVDKPTWLSELWLAGFASALGFPLAYLQEKHGLLFQNVAPTPHNAANLSSESSAILLDFHTETAFHPHMPDFLMLHCLRSDHDGIARTILASVRMALPHLSLADRCELFLPQFRTGVDFSFGSANGVQGNGPTLPVLYGNPYDPYMTFDLDLMVGETPHAQQALEALRSAVNKVRRWVRLSPGDLLIVNNRRAVHARSEFPARFDGRDRWLQRVCLVSDPVPSAADRRGSGRVVETAFAV
ncbi:TauD/TfdA family dioxygenase [Streptomyces sp. NPDC046832]|uniref:TauD/TfdA family dioxygenase n=1 Tax=Streptomyces sp. NPDC046832 TaxID=3155020 RepID=UPI0033FEA483